MDVSKLKKKWKIPFQKIKGEIVKEAMANSYEIKDETIAEEENKEKTVLYGVEDVPAAHLCILFGLQVI